ncbi:hypothetical protein AB674_13835 [Flavobacterium sp. ABG]|nr:hypothetical protein AB674_13835 [Flavobacterium sp. ABG]
MLIFSDPTTNFISTAFDWTGESVTDPNAPTGGSDAFKEEPGTEFIAPNEEEKVVTDTSIPFSIETTVVDLMLFVNIIS